jgi:uncharacterized protein YjiS (DUF1127 family)
LTVKAATTLSHCAGHALPALLLGIVCWAVAEILAGFAAYAESIYPPPAPSGLAPAETDATDTPRNANPSLSLTTMQVNDGSVAYSDEARPDVRAAVVTADCSTARTARRVPLTRLCAARWSSLCRAQDRRRTIEELQSLDDRSLRDIGMSRCDIEHIVQYGVRQE